MADRMRGLAKNAREISGEFPEVVNKKRRAKALGDFKFFCRAYFPEVFFLPFSPDHDKVIAKMERSVITGGLFALAMPRGSGKSALCVAVCLWAALQGTHPFIVLIGATKDGACKMLDGLKTQLETNDLLLEDFPEVCYPIRKLEGITQRRLLWEGQQIRMKFTADRVIFPSLPANKASSAVIDVAGITGGRIRGKKFTRPDKREVRPSLVIIDDPQDDESANSPTQCAARERVISGTVLGMAGPGKKIAAVMPCTVIRKDDLADRMLDRKKHPEWKGERTKLIYSFPTNEKRWDEYAEIRLQELANDRPPEESNAFVQEHWDEMHAGAVAAWPERFNTDELSAVQHAMNLRLRDPRAFLAEYQNEPPGEEVDEAAPNLRIVADNVNRIARGTLPIWASRLVSFIDVQGTALFYGVAAFDDYFTGHLVDYGIEPDQGREYYSLGNIKRTLQKAMADGGKTGGQEAAIWFGLDSLARRLLSRAWKREDGAELRIERCLVDSGWNSDAIYEWCRRTTHAAVVMPSKGVGITAGNLPISEYTLKPHERRGLHYILTSDPVKRAVRLLKYDTNFYKTFLANRLQTLGKGHLSVFGERPLEHRVLTDNFSAEFCIKTEGRGRTVWQWKQIPGRDNHLLDCVVGCLAAAAFMGCRIEEMGKRAPKKRMKITYFA